jgi:hypothetical protein
MGQMETPTPNNKMSIATIVFEGRCDVKNENKLVSIAMEISDYMDCFILTSLSLVEKIMMQDCVYH